jgi:hypothetical protein
MTFKVYGYKSEPADEFGDGDKWEVVGGGALEITRHDRSKLVISPTRWASLEADPSPKPPAAHGAGTIY